MNHQASEDFQVRIRDVAALYQMGVKSLNERYRRAGEWLGTTVAAIRECDESGACGIRLAPGDPGYVSGLGKRVDRGVGRLPTLRTLLESAERHKVCLQGGSTRKDHWHYPQTNTVELVGSPGPASAVHELKHSKDFHEPHEAEARRTSHNTVESVVEWTYRWEAQARITECKVGGEMQQYGDEFAADILEVYEDQPPRFPEICSAYLSGTITEERAIELLTAYMPYLPQDPYGKLGRKWWESHRSGTNER